jgi:MoxR-like ATPase
MNNENFESLLKFGIENKPNDLIISDLKWKYLVRCVLRAENILMVGPNGCAKTMAAKLVSQTFFEDKEEIVNDFQLKELQNNSNIKIEKIEKM